jgi:hypothetical protein
MNDGMTTIDSDDFDSFWQLQAAKHQTSVVVEFSLQSFVHLTWRTSVLMVMFYAGVAWSRRMYVEKFCR